MSEAVGHSPSRSDSVGHSPTMSAIDKTSYLTSNEALELFAAAGLPRSQRSIERYCHKEKLTCFFDTDESRWYVNKKSAALLIGQIKEIQARHGQSETVGQGPTATDNLRQEATTDNNQQNQSEKQSSSNINDEEYRKLRAKVRRMEIDAEVNKRYIERLEVEREKDRELLLSQSHHIGMVETKLQMIEAPKERNENNNHESSEVRYRDVSTNDQDSGTDRNEKRDEEERYSSMDGEKEFQNTERQDQQQPTGGNNQERTIHYRPDGGTRTFSSVPDPSA